MSNKVVDLLVKRLAKKKKNRRDQYGYKKGEKVMKEEKSIVDLFAERKGLIRKAQGADVFYKGDKVRFKPGSIKSRDLKGVEEGKVYTVKEGFESVSDEGERNMWVSLEGVQGEKWSWGTDVPSYHSSIFELVEKGPLHKEEGPSVSKEKMASVVVKALKACAGTSLEDSAQAEYFLDEVFGPRADYEFREGGVYSSDSEEFMNWNSLRAELLTNEDLETLYRLALALIGS